MATKSKNYPQFILALHTDAFKDYPMSSEIPGISLGVDREDFLRAHQSMLTIRQRQHLDNCDVYDAHVSEEDAEREPLYQGDRNYRQVLSYRVLGWKTADGIKLSAYRRGGSGGESRLKGKISVGYGGHIDLADVVHCDSIINFERTVDVGAARELDEEVEVTDFRGNRLPASDLPKAQLLGLMLDDSDDVGRLHAGLLEIQWLEDGAKIKAKLEDGLEDLEVFTLAELLHPDSNAENWTRIAAQVLKKLEMEMGQSKREVVYS